MYSLVLVAALTAGEQAPDLFHGGCHGCFGCNGCCGGCWGCYGGCCGGCFGGCWGCYGGCFGGCYGACYGSCYGYGFGWGYGAGCYGCCGGSCFGGCYGAAFGCYGGCFGGCYGGCWGMGYGCYGSCYGGVHAPAAPAPGDGGVTPPGGTPTPPGQKLPKPKQGDEEKQTSGATKAKLIVEVPADAKLYIDDKLTKATSARREFKTPALTPGQAYFYDVRAEVVREGRTRSATQRVIIRPGQVYRADFRSLDRTVSTARSR
jgi:uncharacterized protein (TIGR03000 family)